MIYQVGQVAYQFGPFTKETHWNHPNVLLSPSAWSDLQLSYLIIILPWSEVKFYHFRVTMYRQVYVSACLSEGNTMASELHCRCLSSVIYSEENILVKTRYGLFSRKIIVRILPTHLGMFRKASVIMLLSDRHFDFLCRLSTKFSRLSTKFSIKKKKMPITLHDSINTKERSLEQNCSCVIESCLM